MSQGRNTGGHRKNRNHSFKSRPRVGDKGREIVDSIDDNNAVIKQFRAYSAELDAKHDRYERIVKINRDITIESKRIIFLLHTIDKESKRQTILSEAKNRIDTLIDTSFKVIAQELEGQDPWQFVRAYKGGLQEFIEAVTFYHYLLDCSLPHWDEIASRFEYKVKSSKIDKEDNEISLKTSDILLKCENDEKSVEIGLKSAEIGSKSVNDEKPAEIPLKPVNVEKSAEIGSKSVNDEKSAEIPSESDKNDNLKTKIINNDPDLKIIKTILPPQDFILGVADLTGELMRKCINNLSTGDIASCFKTCEVVREMHKGFLGCGGISGKEINRKLITLKQSLTKMENVCYTIKVRGSEVPQHMLADVAIGGAEEDYPAEDDEGYDGF